MDYSEIISQFQILFSASREEAKFYLESANYDMDIAAESYLSDKGAEPEGEPSLTSPASANTSSSQNMSNNLSGNTLANPPAPESGQSKPRVNTLHSLNTGSSHAPDENSSEEEGQHFFVGGGGQEVLGPPLKREGNSSTGTPNRQKIIRDVFKGARESGAKVVQSLERSSTKGSSIAFNGAGYRLGESLERQSEVLGANSINTPPTNDPNSDFQVTVKMWENGVSWNDHPLKPYEDSETVNFVMSLKQGQIPAEILREAHGRIVDLQMEDRRNEKYVTPPMKPFSGAGHKLGVPSPNVILSKQVTTASGIGTSSSVAVSQPFPAEPVAADGFNASAPSTQVQIRLVDGARLIAKLNHTQTIAHIRRLIMTYHTPSQERPFVIATTFPTRELTDENLTLVDAKLLGASVIQRFK